MSDLNKKLDKAIVQLLLKRPFYGYLVSHLDIKFDKKVQTAEIGPDGECKINPKWFQKLSPYEAEGMLSHEVMHCVLDHWGREGGRVKCRWDVAIDIEINELISHDFTLPSGALFFDAINTLRRKFNQKPVAKDDIDCFAERLYDLIPDLCKYCEPKEGGRICPKCPIGSGQVKPMDKHKEGKGKGGKGKEDWEKLLAEATTYARLRGTVPGYLEALIEKLLYPKVDWKGLLERYIAQLVPADYRWIPPDKKKAQMGYYLPSTKRESLELVVAIDTSGSISNEELRDFVSEVRGILNSFDYVKTKLIICDCEVHGVYDLDSELDLAKVKITGRGGTSHIPVFEWVERNLPACRLLIAFTDAYSEFPKNEPPYPVIWALTQDYGKEAIPDWGIRVITSYRRRWRW